MAYKLSAIAGLWGKLHQQGHVSIMSYSFCVTLHVLCLNLQEKDSVMHYDSIAKGWLRPALSGQDAVALHPACFTLLVIMQTIAKCLLALQ